jgi:opacity protein-like surface antigen
VASSKITSNETYVASFPPSISGASIVATSNGSGGVGAVFDAFLGVNTLVGSRFVAGLQVEGTLSDVNFDSSGTRDYTYFTAAGPTGVTASSEFRPHVHARWMASALMRVGFLADPDTLLYGIGGWTGAQFEYNDLTDNPFFEPNDSFWANGGSVGAGIERRFGPNWSLRAEYRYTLFQNRDIANNFLFTTSGAGAATASSQSNSIQTAFHNSMQVARLGVAYQLPHW